MLFLFLILLFCKLNFLKTLAFLKMCRQNTKFQKNDTAIPDYVGMNNMKQVIYPLPPDPTIIVRPTKKTDHARYVFD